MTCVFLDAIAEDSEDIGAILHELLSITVILGHVLIVKTLIDFGATILPSHFMLALNHWKDPMMLCMLAGNYTK